MIEELERNTSRQVQDKAKLAEQKLSAYSSAVEYAAAYANTLYASPEEYPARPVDIPRAENEGVWTMQMLLHQMLKGSTELTNALYDNQAEINELADETMKCAMIVITITPILIVYPFIQKYFVKGVMVGSLKG